MGWKDMGAGGRSLAVTGIAAFIAAVAIWAAQRPGPDAQDADRSAGSPQAQTAPVQTAAAPPSSAVPQAAPAKPGAGTEQVSVAPPAFDVVRAETDGSVLVAGRGTPGARVIVMVDGQEAAPATVDAAGRFVAFLALERSGGPKVLALRMELPDGMRIESTGDVIVALPAPPVVAEVGTPAQAGAETPVATATPAAVETAAASEKPAEAGVIAATDTQAAVAGAAAPAGAGQPGSVTQEAAAAGAAASQTTAATTAPAVLVADAQGVRMMGPAPEGVVIDTVGYDAQGRMELGGRAGPEARVVRIYVDGVAQADAPVGAAHDWKVPLSGIAPGVHTVRADELDEKGNVTARYEMPMEAADPARIAALSAQATAQSATAQSTAPDATPGAGTPAPQGAAVEIVTVQPGQSLWRIAKSRYGDGLRYIRLYDANKMQIKDPDLIYPGQVFTLPQ